ncbi:MAG: LytTR family transcriptional regulator [Saprospiraceae bacterium]|nr:LytTR family transcriptional regulator [Saprospiraceae bacterium]
MPRFLLPDDNIEELKQFYLKFLEFKEKFDFHWDIEILPISSDMTYRVTDIIVTSNENYIQQNIRTKSNIIVFATGVSSVEQQGNNVLYDSNLPVLFLPCSVRDIFILCTNLNVLINKLSEHISLAESNGLLQIAGTGVLLKKNNGNPRAIKYTHVLYFEANGEIANIVYTDNSGEKKKVAILKSLGELEEILGISVFFRTHRSFLVNLLNIKDYGTYPQDVFNFELFQDEFVKISRRKRLEIHNRYKQLKKLI